MMFDWHWFATPWALGVLGLFIGSFLNVVIFRLPLMMNREWVSEASQFFGDTQGLSERARLGEAGPDPFDGISREARALTENLKAVKPMTLSLPRSLCPGCGTSLAWHQNVPVLGWFIVRGKCSSCQIPVSPRYPIVEFVTGALFVAASFRFGVQPMVFGWCAFLAFLVAMTMIDADTQLLPDNLTLPLMWTGIALAALGVGLPLGTSIWGAIAGYVPLWAICTLFSLVTGRQGMGNGDFKLLAALGAWLGFQMILPIILISSITCTLWFIARKLTGRGALRQTMPFGPFLCAGGVLVLFLGSPRVMGLMGL